jgi:hypothetical protein
LLFAWVTWFDGGVIGEVSCSVHYSSGGFGVFFLAFVFLLAGGLSLVASTVAVFDFWWLHCW